MGCENAHRNGFLHTVSRSFGGRRQPCRDEMNCPGWQACMLRLLHEVVEQDLNLSFAFEFPTNAKRSLGANVYLTSI